MTAITVANLALLMQYSSLYLYYYNENILLRRSLSCGLDNMDEKYNRAKDRHTLNQLPYDRKTIPLSP